MAHQYRWPDGAGNGIGVCRHCGTKVQFVVAGSRRGLKRQWTTPDGKKHAQGRASLEGEPPCVAKGAAPRLRRQDRPHLPKTDSVDWIENGFFGYGRLAAPLWLIGMEEHCLGDEDAARRLAVLPSFPIAIGMGEAHRRYGFVTLPQGVAVWDVARQLAQSCGLRSDVGEAAGDVLLAELLPLPRWSNDDKTWPKPYAKLFPSYRSYAEALLGLRADRVARLISEQKPRVVLVHGARYHAEIKDALLRCGAVPDDMDRKLVGTKPACIFRLGSSQIVLVHNFGRAAGWSLASKEALSRLVASLWHDAAPDED